MSGGSLVRLPAGAEPPYRVFVSGVPQVEGRGYRVEGRTLVFDRELVQEGRLGFWRWTLMFFSIAGTYRRHDQVDVQYRQGGRDRLATGLAPVPLDAGEGGAEEPAGGGRKPA